MTYISQHPEVADSELFAELPPSLQAEVYDLVLWAAQPTPPRKSNTTEQLLPSSGSWFPKDCTPTCDLDDVVDVYGRLRLGESKVCLLRNFMKTGVCIFSDCRVTVV